MLFLQVRPGHPGVSRPWFQDQHVAARGVGCATEGPSPGFSSQANESPAMPRACSVETGHARKSAEAQWAGVAPELSPLGVGHLFEACRELKPVTLEPRAAARGIAVREKQGTR